MGQLIAEGWSAEKVFLTSQEVQLDGETATLTAMVRVISANRAQITLEFPFERFPGHLHSVRFTNVADPQYRVAASYGNYSPTASLTGTIVPVKFDELDELGELGLFDLVEEANRVTWTMTVSPGGELRFSFDMLGAEYGLSCQFQ